jgi:membrane associated rhomboid family serine protease
VSGDRGASAARREPAIRAPWPALLIAAVLIASFLLQTGSGEVEGWIERFGFTPADLQAGRWDGLVTSLFAHGGWGHVGLNAVGALAFGAPVSRFFGLKPAGVLVFFAFFLVCGALSGLGYAAVHMHAQTLLVGASGAVSGLMGGSSRLIDRRPGLAPLLSPTVVGMAVGWTVVNLLMAVFGLAVVTGGAPIAWEAHLFGYAAGVLLIWPVGRLLRRV